MLANGGLVPNLYTVTQTEAIIASGLQHAFNDLRVVCTVWFLRAGMTGTRSFHDNLLACADDGGSACRWQLRERLLLPNWPTSRLELFVFQKPKKQKSKSKATEEKDRSESDLKPRGERETRNKTNLIPRPGQVSAAGFGI